MKSALVDCPFKKSKLSQWAKGNTLGRGWCALRLSGIDGSFGRYSNQTPSDIYNVISALLCWKRATIKLESAYWHELSYRLPAWKLMWLCGALWRASRLLRPAASPGVSWHQIWQVSMHLQPTHLCFRGFDPSWPNTRAKIEDNLGIGKSAAPIFMVYHHIFPINKPCSV